MRVQVSFQRRSERHKRAVDLQDPARKNDLRRSLDGLSSLRHHALSIDPFDHHVTKQSLPRHPVFVHLLQHVLLWLLYSRKPDPSLSPPVKRSDEVPALNRSFFPSEITSDDVQLSKIRSGREVGMSSDVRVVERVKRGGGEVVELVEDVRDGDGDEENDQPEAEAKRRGSC